MNKKETAARFHSTGCNCAQAVACAFCDEADIDAMKSLTRRYGGGAYKYCGALMGAVAAMNYRDGALDPEDPADMEGKNAEAAEKLRRASGRKTARCTAASSRAGTPAFRCGAAAAAWRTPPSCWRRASAPADGI